MDDYVDGYISFGLDGSDKSLKKKGFFENVFHKFLGLFYKIKNIFVIRL